MSQFIEQNSDDEKNFVISTIRKKIDAEHLSSRIIGPIQEISAQQSTPIREALEKRSESVAYFAMHWRPVISVLTGDENSIRTFDRSKMDANMIDQLGIMEKATDVIVDTFRNGSEKLGEERQQAVTEVIKKAYPFPQVLRSHLPQEQAA